MDVAQEVERLGPWYHNINLNGVETIPGSTPARGTNWNRLASSIPDDLTGLDVLDLGCNAGAFTFLACERNARTVVGVDYSERFIEQAEFCKSVLGAECTFVQSETEAFLTSSKKTFDLIIFVGLLYHMQDPMTVTKLIDKALNPGGTLLLETVCSTEDFAESKYAIIQFPRPHETHSGYTWVNKACIEYLFSRNFLKRPPHYEKPEWIFEGGRIACVLRKQNVEQDVSL